MQLNPTEILNTFMIIHCCTNQTFYEFLIYFKGGGTILRDLEEVVHQNPEPYNSIYNFIKHEIVPKYSCLTSVYQDNFDDDGNFRIQYYLRYAADLTLDEWHRLRFQIVDDVEKFCISAGVDYSIYDEIDFILTVDGDYYEKYGRGF